MDSLNLVSVAIGRSMSLFAFDFIRPQNYFGFYFNMSGSWNCKCALLCLHVYVKVSIALCVCVLRFPYLRCAYRNSLLVAAHFGVNQGARCLSHLFGLVAARRVDSSSTTPAMVAWVSKYFSMRSARWSFESVASLIIALKASANSSVDEWSLHVLALMPYVARQSPVFQR
jgi:hypothetical protein